MMFNSSFLRDGEDGGKNAAILLNDVAQQWAAENVIDCTMEAKVRERSLVTYGQLSCIKNPFSPEALSHIG